MTGRNMNYKKYLIDRSAEFRDIETPKAESYIETKNRLAYQAWLQRKLDAERNELTQK